MTNRVYKIPHIHHLTAAQRKTFTERLMTLHQVLAESKDENYYHVFIIDNAYTRNTCGTAACAVGHAVWHHERFPGFKDFIYFDAFGRPAGLEEPTDNAEDYFGPNSWEWIFDEEAYYDQYGVSSCRVTRQMAMQRIVDYIEQGLGCQLIEDTTDVHEEHGANAREA